MSNCIHNQLESLGQRYLKATPYPDRSKIDVGLLLRIVDHLVGQIGEFYKPEFSFKEYVMRKPGAVRKRFLRAYSQMANGDRNLSQNSRISAFVKNERYFDEGKSPRMIMGRDPRFNVVYARFISRLEDAFFQLPQVANACNYTDCGRKFSKLLNVCASFFENDMSKYEATQRELFLVLEYLVYINVVVKYGNAAEKEALTTVFSAKVIKSVVTGNGLKALFMWCRGSGDLDTGLGNGVGNYITTMYFMIHNFCGLGCKFGSCGCVFDKFVLKGDDSYGVCPAPGPINTYAWFGLDAKLIYRSDARNVEFCSGHFIRTAAGEWTYVQKLRKLVTSVSTCINPDIIKNGWLGHYLKSLGLMYKVLYRGVPVYEDFADMLCTTSKLGINTSLIEGVSYGAWEAFKAGRNTEQVAACPETLLDISEHNEMPIAQLEALLATFRSTNIVLPAEQLKRCNKRSKPDKWDNDPGEIISTWVNKMDLGKQARRVRRRLNMFAACPEKIGTLFTSDPD